MNKRFWGVIIIVLGASLLAAIVYFIFFYKTSTVAEPAAAPPAAAVAQTTAATQPTVADKLAATRPASPLKKTEVMPDDLARMAAAFAERFGSFSNQSDYGNLRDLQIFMTSVMKTWAQNYIDTARLKKADTSIYYGIVTKSILSEIKQMDADSGQAEILVKTQRRESAGVTGNSSTFYQDIIIKYTREAGVWRVDGAYWQAR